MSTKAAHTPTPWTKEELKDTIVISADGIGWAIATTCCYPMDDTTRANAELIITAVNHHQELITRLYNLVNAEDEQALIFYRKEARETLKKLIQ